MATLEFTKIVYKAISAVVDTSSDVDDDPNIRPVTANVDLTYRVPPGWAFRAPNYEPDPTGNPGVQDPTDIGVENFEARLDEGQLLTLGGRPVWVVANTPLLAWPYGDLYLDILFRNVVWNRKVQPWSPFAIKLPTVGGTTINLTTVTREPYLPRDKYGTYFQKLTPVT